MSLLDQAQKNTTPYKLMISERAGQKDEQKFIIQPNILMDIMNDEMTNRVIDKKSKKEFSSYRTKLENASWRLAGTLNFVDEAIWREQINKTIASMLKHIKLRQPNGQWVIMDYEADIRKNKSNDDCIMLAVKFVDAGNERDLRYQNGIPLVDVQVDVSGSNKELIEALEAKSENSNDTELKDLMRQFLETQIAAATPNSEKSKNKKSEVKEDNVLDEVPGDLSQ